MTFTRRRLITLFIAMATFVAVLAPTPVQANSQHKAKRELTVMSRNLYLGADLTPAIELASNPTDPDLPAKFVGAIATIYGEVLSTRFPARSKELVAEIEAARPDLIGLQEVSKWTVVGPPGAAPGYDFLAILLEDLAAAGLNYSVAAVSENATLPPAGFVPSLFPLFVPNTECRLTGNPANPTTCGVQFQDRDVILVSDDTSGLEITPGVSGQYRNQFSLTLFAQELSFDRGWAYVDGKYQGRKFRFINTHLETEDFAEVQELQAAEFLAGPAKKRGTVIAVGDFNSAADGSTTDTYRMLTKRWSFRDAWRGKSGNQGLTCCFDSALADPASELSSRIDLVLIKGWAWARPASVIGDQPFQDSAPYWASDHAGVVATIRLF